MRVEDPDPAGAGEPAEGSCSRSPLLVMGGRFLPRRVLQEQAGGQRGDCVCAGTR